MLNNMFNIVEHSTTLKNKKLHFNMELKINFSCDKNLHYLNESCYKIHVKYKKTKYRLSSFGLFWSKLEVPV